VVLQNASGYAVRAYGIGSQQAFTNFHVQTTDYKVATSAGFQASFSYISGDNEAKVKIPMTAPVIARTNDTFNYDIGFFVPASLYPTLASIPAPTNQNLTIIQLPLMTFAVIEFPGFATEADFAAAEATLRGYLARDNVAIMEDEWSPVWAQYDSPFTVFNRHNELWLHVAV
jgi:hypothetical protein